MVGRVVSYPELRGRRPHFLLAPERVMTHGEPFFLSGLIAVKASYRDASLSYGGRVRIFGRLYTPKNPDYLRSLARNGVCAILTAERSVPLPGDRMGNIFMEMVVGIRQRMVRIIHLTIPPPGNGLIRGMVLGERWEIAPSLRESFYRIGIGHILAVSGLHVGFILFGSLGLLRLLNIGLKPSMFLSIFIIGIYVLITGCRPSTLRAFIMVTSSILAYLLDRDRSLLNGLALAAFLILCFRPISLFDVGFQLSFTATLGIILFLPLLMEGLKRVLPEWVAIPVAISIAAQGSIWPLLAYYFNTFSPIAVLANIVVIPLAGLGVGLGLLGFVMGLVSLEVAGMIGFLNGLILKGLSDFAHLLALLPFSSIEVPAPHPFLISGYYLLICIVGVFGWRKKKLGFF